MTYDDSDVNFLRRNLYSNGFRPLAIQAGEKCPFEAAWPDLARQDPPGCIKFAATGFRDTAGRYHTPGRHPNTGILADGLRPIDIDINDDRADDIIIWCLRHLGVAPIRHRDNSLRVLMLYRAAEGEPPKRQVNDGNPDKTRRGAVEVLGRGNQFLAFGHHPSGAQLKWVDDHGPHNITRADLPPITQAQVEDLLRHATQVLGVEDQPPREPKRAKVPVHRELSERISFGDCVGDGPDKMPLSDIVAYLAATPNPVGYDDWFAIGVAVYAASGGSEDGYRAWYAWSDDPTQCKQTWRALKQKGDITAGTLIYHARRHDPYFRPPSQHIGKLKGFI